MELAGSSLLPILSKSAMTSPSSSSPCTEAAKEIPAADELERYLDYKFNNPALLEDALTHRSWWPDGAGPSYERLEFIGDAAISLAISNHLFDEAPPTADEGMLTNLRVVNVSNEKLARAAVRHGLFRYVRYKSPDLLAQVSKFTAAVKKEEEDNVKCTYGGTIEAPKVLADIVESIAAAIYMDSNKDLNVLWKHFRKILEPINLTETDHPSSILNNLCQKKGIILDCKIEKKGIAKLKAVEDALEKLLQVSEVADARAESEEHGAMQRLNELCHKNKWPSPDYRLEKEYGPANIKKFIYSVEVKTANGTFESCGDSRSNKRHAMNSAASRVLPIL